MEAVGSIDIGGGKVEFVKSNAFRLYPNTKFHPNPWSSLVDNIKRMRRDGQQILVILLKFYVLCAKNGHRWRCSTLPYLAACLLKFSRNEGIHRGIF
jgi:hypothetical protein